VTSSVSPTAVFLFYPGFDYFDDDYDRNYEPPEVSHNVATEPPNAAVAASTKPPESLILENRERAMDANSKRQSNAGRTTVRRAGSIEFGTASRR
jgi:hypothetical protein